MPLKDLIKRKEYHRLQYQKNRQDVLTRQNVKFECPCGGRYTHVNFPIHERTGIHQAFIKTIL